MPRRRLLSNENRRKLLAQEAARILDEQGLAGYHPAKQKAAARMGSGSHGALPSNREIEAALAERQRIFHAAEHATLLHNLRLSARDAMAGLAAFQPKLVGAVLSGRVYGHSFIELHLFADAPEQVGFVLANHTFGYRLGERRQRLRQGRSEIFPAYEFAAGTFLAEATVFPERRHGHAPLSPVDGRPMRRAGLRELESILAETASANQRFSTAV